PIPGARGRGAPPAHIRSPNASSALLDDSSSWGPCGPPCPGEWSPSSRFLASTKNLCRGQALSRKTLFDAYTFWLSQSPVRVSAGCPRIIRASGIRGRKRHRLDRVGGPLGLRRRHLLQLLPHDLDRAFQLRVTAGDDVGRRLLDFDVGRNTLVF